MVDVNNEFSGDIVGDIVDKFYVFCLCQRREVGARS